MAASRTEDLDEIIIQDDNPIVVETLKEQDKIKESEERLLKRAAVYQKDKYVAGLLQRKHDVNQLDVDGRTLLHYAAWFGEVEILSDLLKQDGIQVNLTDERGQSALHHAAFHGNADAVAILLKHKDIEVNSLDKERNPPLRLGICFAEVVAELLNHADVNVNLQDELGRAPLHYAAQYNVGKSVEALLSHRDIKVNLMDLKGWTPFGLAGYHKSGYAASELLKDKNLQVNLKERYDWKAICTAEKKGYGKTVKKFLYSYIANYYNRREKEGVFLTPYGWLFGVPQGSKLAAAGFLLHHLDNLDKIEEAEGYSAHKAALEDGELGNVFTLLKKK
jgi:ankyrin repeat protein